MSEYNLDKLSDLCENEGIFVRFNNGPGLDPLKDAIEKAIAKWYQEFRRQGKKVEDNNKEELKEEKTQTKLAKQQADNSNSIKEEEKKQTLELKIQSKSIKDVERNTKDNLKQQNSRLKIDNTRLQQLINIGKSVKAITGVFSAVATKFVDKAKQRVDWASDLQESGVRLKDGFDESFSELAKITGRSQEDFVKLMTSNSRAISRLNASGINGSRKIANMAGSVVGQWGITGKEADSVIKHYVENMTMFDDINSLRNKNFTDEMLNTTKMLKGLSAATGKSIDQIIEETNARNKNFLHKRLETDSKTAEQYKALKAIGTSDDMIEAILLNKANKASVLASSTPQERRLLRSMQLLAKNTSGKNDGSFIKGLAEIQQSSDAQYIMNSRKNVDLSQNAYLPWDSSYAQILTKEMWGDMTKNVLDVNGQEKQLDNENPEVKAVNEFAKLQATLNNIQTTLDTKTSPNLGTIASTLPTINSGMTALAETLAKVPDSIATAISAGSSAISSAVSSGIGSFAGIAGAKIAGAALAKAGVAGAGAAGAGAAGAGAAATAGLVLAGGAAFAAGGYVGYKGVEYIDEKVSASDKKDLAMYESLKQRYINGEELSSKEMDILKNGVKLGWWGFRSTYGGEKLFPYLEKLRKQKMDRMNNASNSNNIGPAAQAPSVASSESTTSTASETVTSAPNNSSNNKQSDRKEEYLEEISRIVRDVLLEMKTASRKPITNMI